MNIQVVLKNVQYVAEFLLFMKLDKGCSPKTYRGYETDLKEFIDYFSLRDIVHDLKETDIRQYKYWLTEKGNSPRTINRKISVLRSFFYYFVNHQDWDISRSPVQNIKQVKVPQTIPITMDESEAETLLEGILQKGVFAARDYAMFATFLFTGVRVSELINLKVSDVNFKEGIILIRQGKGAKDRVVPMNPSLSQALSYYLITGKVHESPDIKNKENRLFNVAKSGRDYFVIDPSDDTLFLTKYGKQYSVKGVEYLFKSYTKEFGIFKKGLSLNAMRRSCLTYLYKNGVDLFVLKEISGHSKIQTLEHYLVIDNQRIKTAAKKHPLAKHNLGIDIASKINGSRKGRS